MDTEFHTIDFENTSELATQKVNTSRVLNWVAKVF
jgi:hypothetical protein